MRAEAVIYRRPASGFKDTENIPCSTVFKVAKAKQPCPSGYLRVLSGYTVAFKSTNLSLGNSLKMGH